jgi:hypothetical protein
VESFSFFRVTGFITNRSPPLLRQEWYVCDGTGGNFATESVAGRKSDPLAGMAQKMEPDRKKEGITPSKSYPF